MSLAWVAPPLCLRVAFPPVSFSPPPLPNLLLLLLHVLIKLLNPLPNLFLLRRQRIPPGLIGRRFRGIVLIRLRRSLLRSPRRVVGRLVRLLCRWRRFLRSHLRAAPRKTAKRRQKSRKVSSGSHFTHHQAQKITRNAVSASNHGIFSYFAPSAFDFQPFRASTLNSRFFVWVREVVLPQQVFPVVVSIRRSNDTVNV